MFAPLASLWIASPLGSSACIATLDDTILHAIGCGMSSPFWDSVLLTLQRTAVGVPLMLVAIALVAVRDRRRGLRTFVTALVAYGICMGIASLAWSVHHRPRPGRAMAPVLSTPEAIATCAAHPGAVVVRGHVSRRSGMPSRHALSSGAFAVTLLLASRWLGLLASIYALLVATARVYTGVHWPSDVLVGLLLGGGVAALIWRMTPGVFGRVGRRRWVAAPEPAPEDAPESTGQSEVASTSG